jgi:hypothetical protein
MAGLKSNQVIEAARVVNLTALCAFYHAGPIALPRRGQTLRPLLLKQPVKNALEALLQNTLF